MRKGLETVALRLLDTGVVDVDAKDTRNGTTPLFCACEKGLETVALRLLDTGDVDVYAKSIFSGKSVLDHARSNSLGAVVARILAIQESAAHQSSYSMSRIRGRLRPILLLDVDVAAAATAGRSAACDANIAATAAERATQAACVAAAATAGRSAACDANIAATAAERATQAACRAERVAKIAAFDAIIAPAMETAHDAARAAEIAAFEAESVAHREAREAAASAVEASLRRSAQCPDRRVGRLCSHPSC